MFSVESLDHFTETGIPYVFQNAVFDYPADQKTWDQFSWLKDLPMASAQNSATAPSGASTPSSLHDLEGAQALAQSKSSRPLALIHSKSF
jgi:hypothetical protein